MAQLPTGFEKLEQYVSNWALPTEKDRMMKRVGSTMEEIRPFYDEVMPLMEQIGAYFTKKPVSERLSAEEENLFRLGCAYMEVSRCFEAWSANDVRHDFFSPAKIEIMD